MPYAINQQELDAVFALPAPDRYAHFVKRVDDWEEAWGLASQGGWVMVGDPDGCECIPLWPHPAYAEALATGDWGGGKPTPIALADLLAKWLPGMAKDGFRVAVFPSRDRKGAVVDPLRLKLDLEIECEQYE